MNRPVYNAQRAGCPLSALTAQLDVARPATQDIITRLYDRWHAHLAEGVQALKGSKEADAHTHTSMPTQRRQPS
ncbi:hypothetical protein [Streptomyces sp. NBC_00353]|uniref:hypothetical protein n=1 Tax=unclassified Streptomyces TaxID=2593676 RepID=UPI002E25A68C